ncbi:MAG TPA: TolC family protein [Candidatus Binatus sp.]|nr:TolC family protein [Candidatus Binatus sp.]
MIRRFRNAALVLLTVFSLVLSPVFAQAQEGQNPTSQEQQGQPGQPSQPEPAQSQQTPGQAQPGQTQEPSGTQLKEQPQTPAAKEAREMKTSLGPDYAKGKPFFPDIIAPYTTAKIPQPMLTNSPRLDQLIQNGKLMLSLEDAISLALENNLNIVVQKYTPWIAESQILKAKAGGIPEFANTQQIVLGTSPSVSFDPIVSGTVGWQRSTIPVNNPLTTGVGTTSTIPSLTTNGYEYNFGYSQGFHTGTNFTATLDTTRAASNTPENLFNPYVNPILTATLTQPLLNGFGILVNTRYILEAKNSLKVADSQLAQQVMATVQQTSNDYWELVYDRENVKVQEAAVGVSTKLYEDNKKQLQIGTMAPLDVLTAESQVATDQQNLIVAQTTRLQQQTVLLNDITKNLMAPELDGIEIVPTTTISTPEVVENLPLADAVKEAWQKRPEIYQADLNLKNAGIEAKATKNALLPTLDLYAQYSAQGLSGNSLVSSSTTPTSIEPIPSEPIVDSMTGLQIGNEVVGFPVLPMAVKTSGLGNALSSLFSNAYPTYAAGVTFSIPIRNRSAQADNARALLNERVQQTQYRQTQNTIVLNVRNAMIALQQDRAQVAAAEKARTLAQQTLDAEQKKYQLGSSTSYNVVLRSRDLTAAEGTELRAKVNLEEALVNFNQAMGRTLEVNRITMADALRGKIYRDKNIPGTPDLADSMGAK